MPMIIIGSVMVIYTYDEVIKRTVIPMSEELTRCALCGKLTPRVAGISPEDTICSRCKKEVSGWIRRVKRKKRL
jgi:phage FluMu protein Com